MQKFRHILKSQQFNRQDLEELFIEADKMEGVVKNGCSDILKGKIMSTVFFEPSTRTRLSFEAAMLSLGGKVISSENANEYSSSAKGASLEDTIKTISCYANVIILRHYEAGSAERASNASFVPIINAGDGPGQHPTQALLDLYTIKKELSHIDGLKIALVGDLLHGRTVRSLSYLLGKFEIKKIFLVSPEVVKMKDDIKDYLSKHHINFEEISDLKYVAKEVDVIYQTRIQKERFGDKINEYNEAYGKYIIDKNIMSILKESSIVLHPLPRVGEILTEVDSDPRAAYFRQVKNGLYIRMAILKRLLI